MAPPPNVTPRERASLDSMHKQVEKTVLSPYTAPIFGREAFIPVWANGCQPSAMTIASSLMGGCRLIHRCVEDGCKSTGVKFRGLKTRQNWGYGKFNSCIG